MSDKEKEVKQEHQFKSQAAWKEALNKSPNDSWLKKRQLGGGKVSIYMPIPIQQALADIFFDQFDVFDEKYIQIENEILCTIKINCLPSYPNSEPRIISGTGAKPIAARSGSKVELFPKGKITNSLEYCAPNARISAISNAIETFGNVFGRNLGRGVATDYNLQKNTDKDSKSKNLRQHGAGCS